MDHSTAGGDVEKCGQLLVDRISLTPSPDFVLLRVATSSYYIVVGPICLLWSKTFVVFMSWGLRNRQIPFADYHNRLASRVSIAVYGRSPAFVLGKRSRDPFFAQDATVPSVATVQYLVDINHGGQWIYLVLEERPRILDAVSRCSPRCH